MPATVSQLRRPIMVTHVVGFGPDEEVEVAFTYDRNVITDAWLAEWRRQEQAEDAGHKLNEMLLDLLHAWDIQEEDGSGTIPLTLENLASIFNVPDKMRLLGELVTASEPTRAEGEASRHTSSTPSTPSGATPEIHPNGPATSPSVPASASPSPT